MRMTALEEYNQHRRKVKAKKALGFSKERQLLYTKKAGHPVALNAQKGGKIKAKTAEHRKPINPVSAKQLKELAKRRKLRAELIEESGGLCMKCGNPPDFRGLQLIHKVSLAQGGKTNRQNCFVGCGKCHAPFHHIKEV